MSPGKSFARHSYYCYAKESRGRDPKYQHNCLFVSRETTDYQVYSGTTKEMPDELNVFTESKDPILLDRTSRKVGLRRSSSGGIRRSSSKGSKHSRKSSRSSSEEMLKRSHSQSNIRMDEDDEGHRVVQTDPSGRFHCWDIFLGKGACKEVYKALDHEEGMEVAWNQLRADVIQPKDVAKVVLEVELLKSLSHENIINLYHVWTSNDRDGRERVYFITELMTSGNLKSYIKKTKGPLKPKVVRNLCRHIVRGLAYLHSRTPPIIHRDLKCDNIFINGNNGVAKIGDLGLATIKNKEHISSVLGTPEFMAPELYDEKYDERVDIYAFGMCVLELVTKEYPYQECSNQAQIYKKVSTGVQPLALAKVTDEEVKNFIELCIRFDYKERPTALQLLDHQFLIDDDSPSSPLQRTPVSAHLGFDISIQVFDFQPKTGDLVLKMLIDTTLYDSTTTSQCVRFPYDIFEDTPSEIVTEMLQENLVHDLTLSERKKVEEKLASVVFGDEVKQLIQSCSSEPWFQKYLDRNSVKPNLISLEEEPVCEIPDQILQKTLEELKTEALTKFDEKKSISPKEGMNEGSLLLD